MMDNCEDEMYRELKCFRKAGGEGEKIQDLEKCNAARSKILISIMNISEFNPWSEKNEFQIPFNLPNNNCLHSTA